MPLIKVEIWPIIGINETEPYAIRTLGEYIDQNELSVVECYDMLFDLVNRHAYRTPGVGSGDRVLIKIHKE